MCFAICNPRNKYKCITYYLYSLTKILFLHTSVQTHFLERRFKRSLAQRIPNKYFSEPRNGNIIMLNLDGFRTKERPIEIHTTTAYGSYKPNDRCLSHHVSLIHGKGWRNPEVWMEILTLTTITPIIFINCFIKSRQVRQTQTSRVQPLQFNFTHASNMFHQASNSKSVSDEKCEPSKNIIYLVDIKTPKFLKL